MKRIIFLISFLSLLGCTKKYKLSKIIQHDVNNYAVFIYTGNTNTFYTATSPKQVGFLVKHLKLKLWNGYWEGPEREGIIITKNNVHHADIHQNIIRKSNISELKDSLIIYKRETRVCEKRALLTLIDSLKTYSIPYYLHQNISGFYGEQIFKIKYDLGSRKYPSKKEHSTVKKINDSIINLFQTAYPERAVRMAQYTNFRDGRVETDIAVAANEKTEVNNLDKIHSANIASIKQVTVENYKTIEYYINFFVK